MIANSSIDSINNLINRLSNFVIDDNEVYADYQAYATSKNPQPSSSLEVEAHLMSYILNRKINEKNIYDLFVERCSELPSEEKIIAQSLSTSISSTFEIKKVTKEAFQLYNLLNEKEYNVTPLRKMHYFRGIVPKQFLVGRILNHNGTFYLIEIDTILPSTALKNVNSTILMQQLQNPELLYNDNPEKLSELEEIIKKLEVKFNEFFKSSEIITTSDMADDLIGLFNEYFEKPDAEIKTYPINLVKTPETYSYFDIEEISSATSSPMEVASKGFSEHKKIYDAGILFDKDTGLQVIPFYGTFKQIFALDNFKSIDGYKECVLNYLKNDEIPPVCLLNAYNSNNDNFNKVMTDVIGEGYTDIESLLQKYKANYINQKKYSTLTILYSSNVFNSIIETINDKVIVEEKIGRNDPCICGSGKKYKKCCLK